MKRFLLIVITLMLVILLVETTAAATTTTQMKEFTFGLSLWSNSDPLSKNVIRMYEFAAKSLGSKVIAAADGFEPGKQVASVENFISRGVDSVAICPCIDAVIPKLVKICEDAKVPLTLVFRTINDPQIKDYVFSSKYFLGDCHEDEFEVGYNLGKILADKGCKNVAIINYQHGDTTAENRYNGYVKAFNEFNVKVLAEQWGILTADKAAAASENFIAAFPELDGIAVVGGGGGPLEGTVTAIKNNNKLGKILVTGCDFGPTLKDNLEKKEVSAMSGGHWVDPFYTFILAYNYVSGNPLSSKPEEIVMKPLFMASVEDADNYAKWCQGDLLPYTEEEIKNMTKVFNSGMTIDKLKEIAWNYSLEDVMKRHEGLVK